MFKINHLIYDILKLLLNFDLYGLGFLLNYLFKNSNLKIIVFEKESFFN